ncbi:hypothetical protein ALC53_02520 [Atta colombica]|uniref:Uncharacterized protein n=1 Tax=Atta colombica TaxID=520822 RepID=A0A195BRW2_9HYME|nr:hypothetical protein ALC53_02520 [Atta colombica]
MTGLPTHLQGPPIQSCFPPPPLVSTPGPLRPHSSLQVDQPGLLADERTRALQYGNSHLRLFANVSTMKTGLVLGVYETESEDVVLTPTAAKYNELVNGKLLKNILLLYPLCVTVVEYTCQTTLP